MTFGLEIISGLHQNIHSFIDTRAGQYDQKDLYFLS